MSSQATALAFQHARIFDGEHVLPHDTVVVSDGIITAIGDSSLIPTEAQCIDASAQTLLPGLIDAHTHIIFEQGLEEALIFGVTTELDMFSDIQTIHELKRKQGTTEGNTLADLRSSGTLATAPGGHGTEYGIKVPTLTSPAEAQAFVDARIAEGSDYIKIIYDNGYAYNMDIPTLDKETLTALIEAAHRRSKLALVHSMTQQDARDAIEAGADGLAHLFVVDTPDSNFGQFVARHGAFVVPTFTVLESSVGQASGAALARDVRLQPYLTPSTMDNLKSAFFRRDEHIARAPERMRMLVTQLKAAGVPILAGTDAPNPGTAHGVSIHREMELLVNAGLDAREALAAATSIPARIFGLHDRGRIATGLRADLLLVEGDPTHDITATRAIAGIWKQGRSADRAAYRAQVEQQRQEAEQRPAPAGSESGLVSDFEDGTTATRFGSGWADSTDSIRGGTSTVSTGVVPEGAPGGSYSLLIKGEISDAIQFGWAGAMFYPGSAPWQPANLASKKGIEFRAKGDGKIYRIMLFTANMTGMPLTVTFQTSTHWGHHRFSFAQFGEFDGTDLLALLFCGGPEPGPFAFQIDNVAFYDRDK